MKTQKKKMIPELIAVAQWITLHTVFDVILIVYHR